MKNSQCVFSTATDSYIPHAAVSLLAFKKFNAGFDMFILSTRISELNARLCAHCGIKVIELDMSDTFYKQWKYPRECYYHFKGPEIFCATGYEFSVYIDGDTYCNGEFRFNTAEPFHIAGVGYETNKEFFEELGEYDSARAKLHLNNDEGFNKQRIQSGVIIYNNKALVEAGYFDKAASLYDASIRAGLPRKGDDSLLSLLVAAHPEIKTLSLAHYYNLIDFKVEDVKITETDTDVITNCIIYHCCTHKPWFTFEHQFGYAHKFFTEKWLEVMINNFPEFDIARCYPEHYKEKVVEADQIFFYWWSASPNFGDWITPYIFEKICNRKIGAPVDPSKTNKFVILSTGSIMRLCGPNTIVWGSGIRDRHQDIKAGRLLRSTRGPLTRTRILEVGGECPPIYGDPGLLLPKFYRPNNIAEKYTLGIVPHISQFEKIKDIYGDEETVLVIDLRTKNVEAVIDKILSCRHIVSSSLHGIITANAYGIPVRWIQFDTNVFGDNTKYYDHFASIGRPIETFIDALNYKKVPVDDLVDDIQPYEIKIDYEKLLDASVFHNGDISRYIRYIASA